MSNPLGSIPEQQIRRVFVGCSREGLPIARAVQRHFEHATGLAVQVWADTEFRLSESTLVSLEEFLSRFTFGIFIFTPDDDSEKRGVQRKAPRDNVVFELGMFVGRHGRDRCFALRPRGVELHLPTDLDGITLGEYKSTSDPDDLAGAVAGAVGKISRQIQRVLDEQRTAGESDAERHVLGMLVETMHIPAGLSPALAADFLQVLARPGGLLRSQAPTASLLHGHILRLLGQSSTPRALTDAARSSGDVQFLAMLELAIEAFCSNDKMTLSEIYSELAKRPDQAVFGCVNTLSDVMNLDSARIESNPTVSGIAATSDDRLARYIAFARGIVQLSQRQFSAFEQSWDLVRDQVVERVAWPVCPLIGLVQRCDHLLVRSLIASDPEEAKNSAAALFRYLRSLDLRGHAKFLARTIHQLRVSRICLQAFEDFTSGAAPGHVAWKNPITAKAFAVHLGQIEKELWRCSSRFSAEVAK